MCHTVVSIFRMYTQSILSNYKSNCIQLSPAAAIPALHLANKILQPDEGHLTPLQPMLLLCCIMSKHYRFALHNCLNVMITDLEPKETFVTQTDFLLYCYYG